MKGWRAGLHPEQIPRSRIRRVLATSSWVFALRARVYIFLTVFFTVAAWAEPVSLAAQQRVAPIAIDERLAADHHLALGDRVVLSAEPGGTLDTATIVAITKRGADPSGSTQLPRAAEIACT